MLNTRFYVLAGMIVTAAVSRLVPHPPNFTPLAAMALFGGAHFANKRAAFAVPLAAMYLSDLCLGFFVYDFGWFHASMPFVYGSFSLIVILGLRLRRRRRPLAIGASALASSLLFYVITNFGVWLRGCLAPTQFSYAATPQGLLACYVAAIPFFGNTLAGDAIYTVTLFGGFALAQRRVPALRESPAPLVARG